MSGEEADAKGAIFLASVCVRNTRAAMGHGVIFHYEQGRIHKEIDQSLGKRTQQCGFSNSTWMEQESPSIRAWLLYVQQNTMFTGDARAKWRRKVLRLHFNCKYLSLVS